MSVRQFAIFVLVFFGAWSQVFAECVCTGTVTGADGKSMPLAHVSLVTPDRASVLQITQASDKGAFKLAIPRPGFWVLRVMGVGYANQDVALYVPDGKPINLNVALGCHQYLRGAPPLTVVGDFNLWSIPTAVQLKKMNDGSYGADIPSSADSITFRIRGYRDADGVEGIRSAVYVLNSQGSYDARIKTRDGMARIVIDPARLDRSGKPAQVTFDKVSRRTREIAAAVQVWWDGDQAYFAKQMAAAMGRKGLDNTAPNWSSFVAGLLHKGEVERDSLVRSVWDLAYVCSSVKSRHKDAKLVTKCMARIPPVASVWALNPVALSAAVRITSWSGPEREQYIQTVITQNPERAVRLAVVSNEFMLSFHADDNKRAAQLYDLLAREYGDTPEAKQVFRQYPRPDPSSVEK